LESSQKEEEEDNDKESKEPDYNEDTQGENEHERIQISKGASIREIVSQNLQGYLLSEHQVLFSSHSYNRRGS
jgi:hypothetical protein